MCSSSGERLHVIFDDLWTLCVLTPRKEESDWWKKNVPKVHIIILLQQTQIQTVTSVNAPKIVHITCWQESQQTYIFNNILYIVRCVKRVLFSVVFHCGLNMKIKANKPKICNSQLLSFFPSTHSHTVKDQVWLCLLQHIISFVWFLSVLTDGNPHLSVRAKQYQWVLGARLLKTRKKKIPKTISSGWDSSQPSGNPGTSSVCRLVEALELWVRPCFHTALSTNRAPQGWWSKRKATPAAL